MNIRVKDNINLLVIFIFSVIVNLIFSPADFRFNHDAVLSPTALLISESFKNVPLNVSLGIPGFFFSGSFIRYANWPPLHFITLNIWNSFFGYSLFIARLLSVLVSSLTILFLYLLIIKLTENKRLALIGSIIFLFFPFRLLYGSLIFCDIWVPFFWSSGLLLKLICDEKSIGGSTIKKFFFAALPGLYLGIGTLYSWQTFFLLPAFVIYDLIKFKKLKVKTVSTFIIGTFVFILWIVWILFKSHSVSTNSTIQQFLNRSILGFIYSPSFWFTLLIKRIPKFILDIFPLVLILIFSKFVTKNKRIINKESKLNDVLWLSSISVILYLIVMPGMFAPHEFQFIFFNLPFTLLFIFILESKFVKSLTYKVIILYIILSLLEYQFIIPMIHANNDFMHNKIYSTAKIIGSSKASTCGKPLLIINSTSLADSLKGNTIILTYLFNSFTYCLDRDYLKKDSIDINDISKEVNTYYERLPAFSFSMINKSLTYIISDNPIRIETDFEKSNNIITKREITDGVYIYSMCKISNGLY